MSTLSTTMTTTTQKDLILDINKLKTAIGCTKINLNIQLAQLKKLEETLKNLKVSKEKARVGDTLEDGFIVVHREGNMLLLVAPEDTEMHLSWVDRMDALKHLPDDCFIPTIEMLELAVKQKLLRPDVDYRYMSCSSSVGDNYFITYSTINCTRIGCIKASPTTFFVRTFRCLVF